MTGPDSLTKAARLAAETPLPDRTDAFLVMLGTVAAQIINTSPADQAEWLEALAKIARTM